MRQRGRKTTWQSGSVIITYILVFWFCSHSGGRVVSVRSSVSEENPHFFHRHRLNLLPATDSDQQLVELQLMSMSAGEEEKRTRKEEEEDEEEEQRKAERSENQVECLWRKEN